MRKLGFYVAIVFALVFSACSSGGGDSSSSTTSYVTGKVVDGPIEGLDYNCSSGLEAKTNSLGEYKCKLGDEVTFFINEAKIVTLTASTQTLTPYKLFPNNTVAAVNFARLVQTLNENSTTDVIAIDANLSQKLPKVLNFNDANFSTNIENILGKTLVSSTQAQTVMNSFIISIGEEVPANSLIADKDIVTVSVDNNLSQEIVQNLTIIADTQSARVVDENNVTTPTALAVENNISTVISAVNELNEPVLVARKSSNEVNVEVSLESTAELFTMRTRYFYGLDINNTDELGRRIRANSQFPKLVTALKESIEGGSPCPLDHECSYYASTIANNIAQDINISDLVSIGE